MIENAFPCLISPFSSFKYCFEWTVQPFLPLINSNSLFFNASNARSLPQSHCLWGSISVPSGAVIGYTKLTYSKFVWGQNLNYNFRFGSFNRPDELEKDYLHICLDHSWQQHEDDNVIFIDHHLIENMFKNIYRSNADLMYENFEHIYTFFLNMFKYSQNTNFNLIIHIHNDVDGLASGIIFKYILEQKKFLCEVVEY
jgi:hypothetical protein